MKIKDLPTGKYRAILRIRKKSEFEAKGEIIESEDGNKHFLTSSSPKMSFSPNTTVLKFRKEVKK